MNASQLSLDGAWTLTGIGPQEGETLSLAAQVPGNVHPDLLRAGLISDPFWRAQADDCQWVENWEWRYARAFEVPADFPRDWAILRFEGLDTFATILLNGEEIGRTANMFIPHEFEVGSRLRPGANRLEVRFVPVLRALADKPYARFAKTTAFNFTGERVYARKMQCGFGWDWVHRLVTAGIWQPVTLRGYQGARLEDVYVRTTAADAGRAVLLVELTAAVRTADPVHARVRIVDAGGVVVAETTAPAGNLAAPLRMTVPDPKLWWPIGYGAQPLYECRVALADAQGRALDRRTTQIGLRTVAIEQIPDAAGSSFTVVVNGTRVFCQGGNWVPADPFPSQVTPARYERLIGQARDARLVLLRAWGGGIYEPEPFWRACNRAGVMVSQDFLLACAHYPEDDPEFVAGLRAEFTAAIKMLRNHPSLAFWCGDNELGLGSRPDEWWSCKKLAAEVTGPLCAQLDPSRPFRPTSPCGGDPNNSPLAGDMHTNSQFQQDLTGTDLRGYRAYIDAMTGRFMSEYAASGSPPLRSVRRFMTDADLTGPAMWEYHTKNNPHSGNTQTLFQTVEHDANMLYGRAATPEQHVRHLEYVQYEFIRLAMESARRRQFYCSGIQFWMYNDCWPAAGWSVLDYWGGRKAGWYGMASGCKPVIAALDLGDPDVFRWWACNGTLAAAVGTARIFVQPWEGGPRWSREVIFDLAPNASRLIAEIPRADLVSCLGSDSVLLCDLESGAGTDRAWYFAGLPREMELPPARLQIAQTHEGDHGSVTIRTDHYARVVTLEADLDFSDNYFDLLPAETRTIHWKSAAGVSAEPTLVTCWNEATGRQRSCRS
jgi:beta-mannosidase